MWKKKSRKGASGLGWSKAIIKPWTKNNSNNSRNLKRELKSWGIPIGSKKKTGGTRRERA
jgi:hypothetical protein